MNTYMVGIKGVGMTALAVYLKERGHKVWGSDVEEVFPTDTVLKENDIKVVTGFESSNITPEIDLIVTSGAHGGLQNIEVETAKQENIPVMTLAEKVDQVMQSHKTKISVCGTHGKTTTSAMAAFVFQKLGLHSSHLVGVSQFSGLNGGHFGGEEYIIVEADEYAASPGVDETSRFMYQFPDIIICTNIDYDHPDIFSSIEEIEKVYTQFFQKLDKDRGILIYCEEDIRLANLVKNLHLKHAVSYSFDASLKLSVAGRHNKLNAQAIIKLAKILHLNRGKVERYLAEFTGSSRRFEKIFEANDCVLYDDYAHHPAEIKAAIEAAQSVYPNNRIIILFQPHTFSRTKSFLSEFSVSLSKAGETYVTDIFGSAREREEAFTSQIIEEEAKTKGIRNVFYVPFASINDVFSKKIRRGDIVITMGAGSIYQAHSGIIDILRKL